MSKYELNKNGYAELNSSPEDSENHFLKELIKAEVKDYVLGILDSHRTTPILEHPDRSVTFSHLDKLLQELITDNPFGPGIGENTIQIKNLNDTAIADNAISMGEGCVAGSKAFYVASIGEYTFTLDSLAGLDIGDICSVMFLDIMNDTGRVDRVYQNFGTIVDFDLSTNTITFDVAAPTSSDPTVFVGFMCVLDKPNIGTQMTGIASFSGGYGCITLGDRSRAYGSGCIAVGKNAVAEGDHTKALNKNARAVGSYTEALGVSSSAEGNHTKALAGNTHAEGDHTIAGSTNQHVQGKYNIEDRDNKYADIVGNGTDEEHRSNAYTLDWDGNGTYAGEVFLNGGKHKAAKEKVWETISTITVEPDENGELSPIISFTKDSNGNDFELTDFYLETQATVEVYGDWSVQDGVVVFLFNDNYYFDNLITDNDYSTNWYVKYETLGDNSNGLISTPTAPFNFDVSVQNAPNMVTKIANLASVKSISLLMMESDRCRIKAGSTLTLKGVRK